jgi:hypothetical protein
MDQKEFQRKLSAAEAAFVENVLKVIKESGINRTAAEQKVAFMVTGIWCYLERRLDELPGCRGRIR